jgi:hypothetical protein
VQVQNILVPFIEFRLQPDVTVRFDPTYQTFVKLFNRACNETRIAQQKIEGSSILEPLYTRSLVHSSRWLARRIVHDASLSLEQKILRLENFFAEAEVAGREIKGQRARSKKAKEVAGEKRRARVAKRARGEPASDHIHVRSPSPAPSSAQYQPKPGKALPDGSPPEAKRARGQ